MKQDRRVLKTKRAIRQAFMSLVQTNEPKNITVTDICLLADINRKTFYNNYADIDQLVEEIEYEIVGTFEALLVSQPHESYVGNPQAFFELLTETIRSYYTHYATIISGYQTNGLVEKVKHTLTLKVKEFMIKSERFDRGRIDWIASYVISGVLGLYQDLFSQAADFSTPEIARMIKEMIMSSVHPFIQIKEPEQQSS